MSFVNQFFSFCLLFFFFFFFLTRSLRQFVYPDDTEDKNMRFDLFLRPPLRPVLHNENVCQFSGNRQLFLSYEM